METTGISGIREAVLRELAKAQPELRMCVVGRGDAPGFMLLARYGDTQRVLVGSRKVPRTFATLDAAANCVRGLGMTVFEVDVVDHQGGRVRAPRADRAEAMRLANQRSTPVAAKKRTR